MDGQLNRLLRPRSIAVVGGGAWCAAVVEQNLKIDFDGPVWPVHPTRDTVGGVAVHPNLAALPSAPDATFVGVNRHATIDVLSELKAMGAGGAVCFASGFGERDDGVELQSALLNAADRMPFLGPNCYGFVNYLDRVCLWPDQHGGVPVATGVAVVTQSSNVAINMTMQRRGLPLAYMVTSGNQAQTGLADTGAALLEDDRVTALGLHIEGVQDLRAFERLAALAAASNKPVVVLKVGASAAGHAAALSHTAALAGSEAGAKALFKRLGFIQVDTLPVFLETLKLVHATGPIGGSQVASMSCSGGEAGLVADTAERHGLSFPPLSKPQCERLQAILGPLVTPANPLDYHTQIWGDEAATSEAFTAMMETPVDLSMVILDVPRDDRCAVDDWEPTLRACVNAQNSSDGKLAVVSTLPESMPEAVSADLLNNGIVPLAGLDEACAAIAAAADCEPYNPDIPILLADAPNNTMTLDETAAKAALARHGIGIPLSRTAGSAHDAVEAANEIGFPVVLKGFGFAHKSEHGAVRLGLTSADAVREAALAMASERYLIEQMIAEPVAELLVGVVRDEAHGFVLTLAAGGVLTELLVDRQSLLLPVEREAVERALGDLRISRVLSGYRGRPAADFKAIVDAVMAVQDYVIQQADGLQEIEINPLLCGTDGAVAVDALIVREAGDDR